MSANKENIFPVSTEIRRKTYLRCRKIDYSQAHTARRQYDKKLNYTSNTFRCYRHWQHFKPLDGFVQWTQPLLFWLLRAVANLGFVKYLFKLWISDAVRQTYLKYKISSRRMSVIPDRYLVEHLIFCKHFPNFTTWLSHTLVYQDTTCPNESNTENDRHTKRQALGHRLAL